MIEVSNREYLMTRDFVFITIAMIAIYFALSILKLTIFDWKFTILLGVLLIINIVSANIKAKRFVYNVIAIDLSKRASK